MKFCFVAHGYRAVNVLKGDSRGSGGAESQMAYIAASFSKLGHQVELIYGNGAPDVNTSTIANIKCIEAFPAWRNPQSLLTFWNVLKKSAADIIYANLPDDFLWFLGLHAKFHPESRFVYSIQNDIHCSPWGAYHYRQWFHEPLYALGLRAANIISIQHERQAQLVSPHVRGQLVLVPPLIRSIAHEPRKYEETDIDVVWVALIRPVKQLHLFLDIAERLPELQFAVVGGFDVTMDDSTRNTLEARMRSLKNLRFMGSQRLEDVIQFLNRSKILVNTSAWEGFPSTMLEAWSVGVPVVSLTVDPDGVVRREGIGLVCETTNKLTHDIERLVQDQSMNIEMGKRAIDYVWEKHSLIALCRAFERIIPGVYTAMT